MSDGFLDTNIILRHLLNDDPVLSARARAIIQGIEQGAITVWTSELVIAEVVFVLAGKKTYNQAPQQIADVLVPLIQLSHLKLPRKRVLARAFALFTGLTIDYIDAYNAALMEHRGEAHVLSFDTDFDRIAGIRRHTQLIEGSLLP